MTDIIPAGFGNTLGRGLVAGVAIGAGLGVIKGLQDRMKKKKKGSPKKWHTRRSKKGKIFQAGRGGAGKKIVVIKTKVPDTRKMQKLERRYKELTTEFIEEAGSPKEQERIVRERNKVARKLQKLYGQSKKYEKEWRKGNGIKEGKGEMAL